MNNQWHEPCQSHFCPHAISSRHQAESRGSVHIDVPHPLYSWSVTTLCHWRSTWHTASILCWTQHYGSKKITAKNLQNHGRFLKKTGKSQRSILIVIASKSLFEFTVRCKAVKTVWLCDVCPALHTDFDTNTVPVLNLCTLMYGRIFHYLLNNTGTGWTRPVKNNAAKFYTQPPCWFNT